MESGQSLEEAVHRHKMGASSFLDSRPEEHPVYVLPENKGEKEKHLQQEVPSQITEEK